MAEQTNQTTEDLSKTIENDLSEQFSNNCKVSKNKKNRGTGAGGANTNKSGLEFEKNTNLDNFENEEFINLKKKLFKHFKINTRTINGGHGCKQPDECFLSEKNKNLFIIEKKKQQCSGSICEKIQTPEFKIWFFNKHLDNKYKIIYIYCLSDWFKDNCKEELEYLKEKNIPVFFGNDTDYKTQIMDYMINYK
jgi:hypothetical protein